MHRLFTASIAAAVAAALLVAVAAAPAGARRAASKAPTAQTVIKNCASSATGSLTRPFSARLLRAANRKIRGDLAEYTNCYDAVRRQLRRSNATVVAGIARSAGGSFVKGKVALLDRRGRTVDVRTVRAGKRTSFKVVKGVYTVRANGRKACSASVTAKAKKTRRVTVVCR